jgi:hypothetical protein
MREQITREQLVGLVNDHLDQLIEMVTYRIKTDPSFSVHDLVEKLSTAPEGARPIDHICTLSYNLALALFRLSAQDKDITIVI